jgi:hypothetical protein
MNENACLSPRETLQRGSSNNPSGPEFVEKKTEGGAFRLNKGGDGIRRKQALQE